MVLYSQQAEKSYFSTTVLLREPALRVFSFLLWLKSTPPASSAAGRPSPRSPVSMARPSWMQLARALVFKISTYLDITTFFRVTLLSSNSLFRVLILALVRSSFTMGVSWKAPDSMSRLTASASVAAVKFTVVRAVKPANASATILETFLGKVMVVRLALTSVPATKAVLFHHLLTAASVPVIGDRSREVIPMPLKASASISMSFSLASKVMLATFSQPSKALAPIFLMFEPIWIEVALVTFKKALSSISTILKVIF